MSTATTTGDIETRVINIIAEEADLPREEITLSANIISDLPIDSLTKVEILMRMEDEFELSIPDEDEDRFKTVGDAVDYITTCKERS